MSYNYLIPIIVVLVQGVCAYLCYQAYRAEHKRNVLASMIGALLTMVLAVLAPYVDSLKSEATLRKQAKAMQQAIADGTSKLNNTSHQLLVAQGKTQEAVEALRQSQLEVAMLHNVINKYSVVTTNSTGATGKGIQVTKPVRSPMLNNTGQLSTEGGSIMVGGSGNRITHVGEPSPIKSILDDVSGFTTSEAYVKKGQRVRIIAAGSIRVGPFVGGSTPEGRSAGVMGLDLSDYNLERSFNHGALLYRIEGDESWQPYGPARNFTAQRGGHIEFQVNDKEQGNNSGSYQVTTQLFALTD